jgi:endonuclease/exonuclease/phosphatase family metal-dependent hydrolase
MTAGGLFTNPPRFVRAPDPSPLLRGFSRKAPPKDLDERLALRILSYNVALYDPAWYLEFYDSASPFLEERRRVLGGRIFGDGYDIIFLQEVMVAEDVSRFEKSATEHGYTSYVGSRISYNDRLMLFVKNDLLEASTDLSAESVPFIDSVAVEFFPGPKVWRGYQRFSFTHPRLGRVHLYNTHMAAYSKHWRMRMEQARQLGLDMAKHAGKNELAILGGDLNFAPYYKLDEWGLPDGGTASERWREAMSYAVLLHYGELKDLFVAGKRGRECLLDVETVHGIRNVPERSAEIPGGVVGFCESPEKNVLTAVDCNSLHFQNYRGKAYPARLDHLIACDPQKRIYVMESGLTYTDRVRLNSDTKAELSDHYGIQVELAVEPLGVGRSSR